MKNLPNTLSAIRILLVPVFVAACFLGGEHWNYWAALIFLAAAVTDFLDGRIARKYGLVTNLGKVLDPVGDKLMTMAMAVCLAVKGIVPVWVPWFFLVKEALMAAGGIYYHSRISEKMPGANIFGKTATFAIFCVGLTLMLFKVPGDVANALVGVVAALSLAALGSYVVMLAGIWRRRGKSS